MLIFVTGGTGFIGSLVVSELIKSGHEVLGLARSDEAEKSLIAAGAKVLRGSLSDTEVLKKGASSSDGVIHLGFTNDFSHYDAAVAVDIEAVKAIGSGLMGSEKPFVCTSGSLACANLGRVATEEDRGAVGGRVASEEEALKLAELGVRSSVVRLAPCVHDVERQGFGSLLAGVARQKGASGYLGAGERRWPAVHRRDAAHLFCLALQSAPKGSKLHGVAEEGVSHKDIADAIGRRLKLPVKSFPYSQDKDKDKDKAAKEEAEKHFGWNLNMLLLDNPTSSEATRKLLNWKPAGPSLLEDILNSADPAAPITPP
jgi:nucleoside-diphosphate-sugar epimerase